MIEEGLWILLFLLEEGENKLAGPYSLSAIVPLWTGCCCIAQSCLTLCDPMDCSPPGSSVHWILQARRLEWVAMPSFRGSSWPRGWTHVSYVSCTGRWVLYHLHHLGSPGTSQYLGNKACDHTTPNSNAIYPSFLPLAIQRLGSGLESHTSLYLGLEQILRQGSCPLLVSVKQRKKYRDSCFPLPRAKSEE